MTLHRAIHENMLINILNNIFADASTAPFLAFKGGTAAMLFYGLPRFSVDLDFDLLDSAYENHIFNKVKEILENYGTVKKADIKKYTIFFLLSYKGKIDGAYNIKVEINKRNFGAHYHILTYLGIAVRVMEQSDMAAHKLMAMYERLGDANRDIYDVWFFLKQHWPINKKNIEERMEMQYEAFLQLCINELERFDNKNILAGLGQLLTEKQKAWVKANLLSETIFLLRLALKNETGNI